MRLLHLHVESFGTLHDFSLSPADGLNVLYQKNGWGKSTLAVFIKAMLYGLPASSRRSLDENERRKYTPWQGGAYGGSLEFECQKGRFRVERFFGAKEAEDSFSLFDLTSNKPSSAFSENLGAELFGIDADGFERSTYLSQRVLGGSRDTASISAKLGDLLDDVGDIGGYDTAMTALDKRRSYYVKTGNRGAIAEMEQEQLNLQNDCERCMRIEHSAKQKQAELDALTAQLTELQGKLEQTRNEMQKASLGREKVAHVEQKDTMQAELRRMTAERDRINDFFQNAPPSPAELGEGRRLYEEIKEANGHLQAIPEAIPEADRLETLRRRYPNGAPIEKLEHDTNELISLSARLAALNENPNEIDAAILARFPNGAPDRTEIAEAYQSVKEATALQQSAQTTAAQADRERRGHRGGLLSGGIGAIAIGVFALAFTLWKQVFFLPLLIAEGLALTCGVVLLAVGISRKNAHKRRLSELEKQMKEDNAEAYRILNGVAELLAVYGIKAGEGEVGRGLDMLADRSERYWTAKQQQSKKDEGAQALRGRMEVISSRLYKCFSILFPGVEAKTDWRAELDRVKQEIMTLEHLERSEKQRAFERARAQAILDAKREELLPFLRRFDPAGKMRAGECLNCVGERSAEFIRLEREIAEKKKALSGFIVSKKLDKDEPLPDSRAYDRLALQERQQQEELEGLRKRQTALRGELERMALDIDRISDLTDAIAEGKQRLLEAKANAATIAHTAKYLEQAKTALSTRYLDGMQKSFSEYLASLTQKAAPESVMDSSFEVRLREGGATRSMESFSRGWRDAVEFCTRLSLTKALFREGEQPFLLLDDPFVNLDDARYEAARAMLEELARNYQILYFVCHKDRI